MYPLVIRYTLLLNIAIESVSFPISNDKHGDLTHSYVNIYQAKCQWMGRFPQPSWLQWHARWKLHGHGEPGGLGGLPDARLGGWLGGLGSTDFSMGKGLATFLNLGK